MGIRIDPTLEFVWRDPGTVQLGVDPPRSVVPVPTVAEERFLCALRRETSRDALTALAATTGLGYALGSSIAGRLADWGGHTPAFAVTVTAGLLATLLTLAGAGTLRRTQDRTTPPPVPVPEPVAAG